MLIMFPHGELIFKIEIKEAHRVLEGHIGYRRQNEILLRSDIFKEFHYAHMQSDFFAMKKILDNLIDLDNCELEYVRKENVELPPSI